MYEAYIQKGARRLRLGYTTGTCAAGAASAAARMLLSGEVLKTIAVALPAGEEITLEIENARILPEEASCAVRKDGGDDPDATHGMLIYARVFLTEKAEEIEITGGEGIGTVTKPGLDQPVGAAAINSVPRQMIRSGVREAAEAFSYRGGLHVEISAPGGEEIAKKTFNPQLGIKGGISIIGTTGIVEPMSNAAILGTVRAELSMRRAAGESVALLTLGNYGKSYLKTHFPALSEKAVACSNFIGDSIDLCLEAGFSGILILGHFGKLVKLGAGIMNTHSSFADGRMEVLLSCALRAGADLETLRQIADSATTDAAIAQMRRAGVLDAAMEQLSIRVDHYLRRKVKDEVPVGAVLFTETEKVTVQTAQAAVLLKRLT